MESKHAIVTIFSLFLLLAVGTKSQDFPAGSCGKQTNDTMFCEPGFCCSSWGFCGTTDDYCGPGCQSQCPPPPSPPPPPPPITCGIQHGGARCPLTMCCTVQGFCANSKGPLCSKELCQSQCGGEPTCGVEAGGAPCPLKLDCCTKAGFCAPFPSPACAPPFCQSQCVIQADEPRISMVTAIA